MSCRRTAAARVYVALTGLVLLALAGCGSDNSPSSADRPAVDPITGEELELLPQVSAGVRQFADPNVLVVLRGSATPAAGATITEVMWTQLSGPEVTIPDPQQLQPAVVVPDLLEETELTFLLGVEDSEGRTNSAVAFLYVRPLDVFARAIGGTVGEQEETAVFSVKLNAPQTADTVVNYVTRAGTAEEGSDYVATQGSLLFAAGETEKMVSVRLIDSDPEEGSEYFSLDITVVSEANPASNSAVMLIINNPDVIVDDEIAFINPGPLTVAVGEGIDNPIDPDSIDSPGTLVYTSSNPTVATVDQQGQATAVALGSATITAAKAGGMASYDLTVVPEAESLTLSVSESVDVEIGLAVFSGTATIDWGDGTTAVVNNRMLEDIANTGGLSIHRYGQAFTGEVRVVFSHGLNALKGWYNAGAGWQYDVDVFIDSERLEVLNLLGTNSAVNGDLATFSDSRALRELRVNVADGNLSGELSGLPGSMTLFEISAGQGAITGPLAGLPSGIVRLIVDGSNTISGDVGDIPASMEDFRVENGANTISGAVAQIPPSMSSFTLGGENTLAGNIQDLPVGVVSFRVAGENAIGGDLGLLQNEPGITFNIDGQNVITGDVANIPISVIGMFLGGNNTLFGDIQNLRAAFNGFAVNGQNTISGDLGLFDAEGPDLSIAVRGINTIEGIVARIPPRIIGLTLDGNNTVSGGIEGLHADMVIFDIDGNNRITGDLGLLQNSALTNLSIRGDNGINQLTDPPLWDPVNLNRLILDEGDFDAFGFSSTQVDDLLIFLNDRLGPAPFSNSPIIVRRFNDSPRTFASDDAVAGLEAKGYFVETNFEIEP
ncbi:hypothetical protein FKG94_25950 [Exilibacterium tricleocarpae]|uniref:Calx-beta domain-containing protein n=1 Tax=Exilibacterium tricleocarpae TaxID=2591008 RepID=A0A545SQI1_9GAMM|nr:Calx-beta domain-containing protein [Exilibacterium tricleocarpae]TQV67240.1 hypothetical protein FKG94_25950 [Exilibacterium tricleocarpae]